MVSLGALFLRCRRCCCCSFNKEDTPSALAPPDGIAAGTSVSGVKRCSDDIDAFEAKKTESDSPNTSPKSTSSSVSPRISFFLPFKASAAAATLAAFSCSTARAAAVASAEARSSSW